ncbi:MAG: cytidylyltransferase domain-containing protein [Spirochaetaceae bacterium]
MTGVFLQVRLDSSRLPGKALLPLEGDTVVGHAMRALRNVHAQVYLLLTDSESAGELRPHAEKAGFEVFAGAKDDVLLRYTDAARLYGVDRIIRATGDNPLVSAECADRICVLHRQAGADYSGFRGLPLGTGVECVEAEALFEAEKAAVSSYDREHVCPYLYRHPERFSIHTPQAPGQYRFPEARVTLDTEEDYIRLKELFKSLYNGSPVPIDRLVPALSRYYPVAG